MWETKSNISEMAKMKQTLQSLYTLSFKCEYSLCICLRSFSYTSNSLFILDFYVQVVMAMSENTTTRGG